MNVNASMTFESVALIHISANRRSLKFGPGFPAAISVDGNTDLTIRIVAFSEDHFNVLARLVRATNSPVSKALVAGTLYE
jgi:hypothetical protein